jgi:hypothetical protein
MLLSALALVVALVATRCAFTVTQTGSAWLTRAAQSRSS